MKLCSKLEVSSQFSQLCWKMTLKNCFIFNIEEKILTLLFHRKWRCSIRFGSIELIVLGIK